VSATQVAVSRKVESIWLKRETLQEFLAVFELDIFSFDVDDAIMFEFLNIPVEYFAYRTDQACDLFMGEIMDEMESAFVSVVDIFGDQLQQAG
jgi:hypothetical protein